MEGKLQNSKIRVAKRSLRQVLAVGQWRSKVFSISSQKYSKTNQKRGGV